MIKTKPDLAEFNDPRLAAIYNTICPLDGYEKLYINLAKRLSASTIIDIGCGTGLLTCELANRGHTMIGIEPSKAMLNQVRKSPCGNNVQWIHGDTTALGNWNADLAIMTGHVAQFLISDKDWNNALQSIHGALQPGGYLAFESRNPATQSWNTDKKQKIADWCSPSHRKKAVDPVAGPVEAWAETVSVKDNQSITDIHYHFERTGEKLISRTTLIFRTQKEITQSLSDAGFSVEHVYGDWDESPVGENSPELIFVARK